MNQRLKLSVLAMKQSSKQTSAAQMLAFIPFPSYGFKTAAVHVTETTWVQ